MQDDYPFDISALQRKVPRRRRIGFQPTDPRIVAFAGANGLDFDEPHEDRPSLSMLGPRRGCYDVVLTRSEPIVEFANDGSYLEIIEDEMGHPFTGLIAVRHGLVLPRVRMHCSNGGKASVSGAARTAFNLAAMLDVSGWDEGYQGSRDRTKWVKLAGRDEHGVSAEVVEGEEEAAWRLLTPEVLTRAAALAESFSIEIDDDWMIARSPYGWVVTTDPEVWAWAFSVASRLADLAHAWRTSGTWPAVDGAALVPWDFREAPFYTGQWVTRPASLDGVLSRRSLREAKERASEFVKDEARERGAAALARLRRGRGKDEA